MKKTGAQLIGLMLQFLGVLMMILFALTDDYPICGFGILVGLIGKVIYEYWDDWFP